MQFPKAAQALELPCLLSHKSHVIEHCKGVAENLEQDG